LLVLFHLYEVICMSNSGYDDGPGYKGPSVLRYRDDFPITRPEDDAPIGTRFLREDRDDRDIVPTPIRVLPVNLAPETCYPDPKEVHHTEWPEPACSAPRADIALGPIAPLPPPPPPAVEAPHEIDMGMTQVSGAGMNEAQREFYLPPAPPLI
jgi:hypothetical protein